MPGVLGQVQRAGARGVEFVDVVPEQHRDAPGAQVVDAAGKRGVGGDGSRLVNGSDTTGIFLPIASVSRPRARVSLMPAAHLLIVLKVAGATIMASGGGAGRRVFRGPCTRCARRAR